MYYHIHIIVLAAWVNMNNKTIFKRAKRDKKEFTSEIDGIPIQNKAQCWEGIFGLKGRLDEVVN